MLTVVSYFKAWSWIVGQLRRILIQEYPRWPYIAAPMPGFGDSPCWWIYSALVGVHTSRTRAVFALFLTCLKIPFHITLKRNWKDLAEAMERLTTTYHGLPPLSATTYSSFGMLTKRVALVSSGSNACKTMHSKLNDQTIHSG